MSRLSPALLLMLLAVGSIASASQPSTLFGHSSAGASPEFTPIPPRAVLSSVVFLILFCGAGAWVVYAGMRRRLPGSDVVRELGSWTLTGGARLHAVRFSDRVLLLSSSTTHVANLGEIPLDAWPDDVMQPPPTASGELLRAASAWVARRKSAA